MIKKHLIQTIAIQNSQIENIHKKSSKKTLFLYIFYREEISGVVGRKSEQCLAQAESIWNAIGQQDRPIRA